MQGLKHFMVVAGLVTLVIGGTGSLTGADPGSAHDPHGKQPHAGMGYEKSAQGMEHHGGLSPLDMKEELGLSEDQVARLRPLELDYRKTMIQNGADLRVAMVDMGTLMDAKQADMAAITRKVDEISLLQKNMMMYRVGVYFKVKEVLTPVQYEQFRSRLREHMEGMAFHGGEMHEGKNPHGEYQEK
ncbi:MAG TPA: Spy/CpxP family protein refolding chaperone [Nitrospirales bacterium]|nr:Spy/CpxP family protein refolding chaperone [Nitrospirales bacterium]